MQVLPKAVVALACVLLLSGAEMSAGAGTAAVPRAVLRASRVTALPPWLNTAGAAGTLRESDCCSGKPRSAGRITGWASLAASILAIRCARVRISDTSQLSCKPYRYRIDTTNILLPLRIQRLLRPLPMSKRPLICPLSLPLSLSVDIYSYLQSYDVIELQLIT
ncbi:hypothetical protein ACP70R_027529 [Stipagrostis hirtigluma subsp. patula]